jgi:hypothetical protein
MASHPFDPDLVAGTVPAATPLRAALLDSLYCDILVLADDVRAGPAPEDVAVDPMLRVRVACESLRLSARLMRMTQLLLDHRAGRMVPPGVIDALTIPISSEPLPAPLHDQLASAARLELRLADLVAPPPTMPPPVLGLQDRLTQYFS